MYVIVYVGYEGIEEVLWAGHDPEEAWAQVTYCRKRIAESKASEVAVEDDGLEMMERQDQTEPWCWLDNPDHVCVMKSNGYEFACVCDSLGVAPTESVLY